MPESENFSSAKRGLDSEIAVLEYYEARRWQALGHRLKTPFGEVDLILQRPDGAIVIIEVKSIASSDFVDYRLTRRQRERLTRVFAWFAERIEEVDFNLVFVDPMGTITVVENVMG